jgi:hypothetical protein
MEPFLVAGREYFVNHLILAGIGSGLAIELARELEFQ